MRNSNFYKAVLAAYLHDMGKLLRRGGYSRSTKNYIISHSEYVYSYFNNGTENFVTKKLISDTRREIGLLASLHHYDDLKSYKNWENDSQKEIARCVYMADNIASKERVPEKGEDIEKQYKDHIRSIGLQSPFSLIFNSLKNDKESYQYIPESLEKSELKPTIKAEGNFEQSLIHGMGNTQISEGFKKLAEEFLNGMDIYLDKHGNLNENSSAQEFELAIYDLDILLQNYWTLIPADAYTSAGDVSLYDHVKITASVTTLLMGGSDVKKVISVSAKDFFANQTPEGLLKLSRKSTTDVLNGECILIGGDFPSIQKYIVSGIKTTDNPTKRLRSRSLMVQLINESVIQYLLNKLEIPRANIMMNAGGKFVIIADNNICEINGIVSEINSFFIEEFGTKIKLNIIAKNYKYGDIFGYSNGESGNTYFRETKDVFVDLFRSLSENKSSVYSKENYQQLFNYDDKKFSGKMVCRYCGENYIDKTDDTDIRCEKCNNEILLGEKVVKNTNGIYLQCEKNGKYSFNFSFEEPLDFYLQFNKRDIKQEEKLKVISKSINLFVPKDGAGNILPFEGILMNEKYLCMLKGDIDSMSIILQKGFDSAYSISRIVGFSRFLEYFFGHQTNRFLENQYSNVYTVYSGGDDFVLILPYSQRKKFLADYFKFFKETIKNTTIHFSTGIALFKPKTPITAVDEKAERLLKESKLRIKNYMKSQKDEITLLSIHGVTRYENSFTKMFDTNDSEVENKYTISSTLPEYWNIISSTFMYTIYLSMRKMIKANEEGDWSKYIVEGARIINAIKRNIRGNEEEKKQLFSEFNVLLSFSCENDKDKQKKINNLLLGIVDKLYEERNI